MKKFIKDILLIGSTMLLICIVLGTVHYVTTNYLPNKSFYAYNPGKHILFLGDSQPETAIDDGLFKDAFNLSRSSDMYIYAYSKLKKIYANNPQIDTLLLAYDSSVMGSNIDYRLHGEGVNGKLVLYSSILEQDDYKWFNFEEIKDNIIKALFPTSLNCLHGGYTPLPKPIYRKPFQIAKTKKQLKYGNDCAIFYLNKIIKYCQEYHIKLIFIAYPTFTGGKDTDYWRVYYRKYYTNILLLDYENIYVGNQSHFHDALHLNFWGAKVFTEKVMTDLRKIVNTY